MSFQWRGFQAHQTRENAQRTSAEAPVEDVAAIRSTGRVSCPVSLMNSVGRLSRSSPRGLTSVTVIRGPRAAFCMPSCNFLMSSGDKCGRSILIVSLLNLAVSGNGDGLDGRLAANGAVSGSGRKQRSANVGSAARRSARRLHSGARTTGALFPRERADDRERVAGSALAARVEISRFLRQQVSRSIAADDNSQGRYL